VTHGILILKPVGCRDVGCPRRTQDVPFEVRTDSGSCIMVVNGDETVGCSFSFFQIN
jgi:hypothetical protein